MGITERLQIIATHNEPLNKHVIWLKDDMLKRWTGVGWENIGGTGGSGTTNYNELINKPSINGITLEGNVKLNLEGYTKDEIDNKFNNLNIPNIDLKEYAKKSEIPSIEGLASETFVTTKIAEAQLGGSEVDLSDYATKLELQESIESISIPSLSGYATELWVNDQGFIKTIPEDYAKKSDIPSLDDYATQQFVIEKINEAQLGDKEVDLSGYATQTWVNKQGFLTSVPSDYAKKSDIPSLDGYAKTTDIPSLSGYATQTWVGQQGFLKEVPSEYITEQELRSQGFALSAELANYQRTITDLDTIRQGAAKGATALQSYTEQYKGTVTGIKINNSTKNPTSGIVDIGNVVTRVKINSSTKNPNNGIVDLGTVLTSHQDISGKQDRIIIVNHGTSDTTFTMTPNVLHKWDTITSLTLTFPTRNDSYVDEYKAVFTAGTNFSMAVPDTMKWVNGQIPSFTEGTQYELSILDSRILICSF